MISAVILTKNEENNIIDCLESLLWCDEIVIVDDESRDRTLEIIKNLKNENIEIFTRPLENNFSAQRNFGLSKANGEWVLFVDADERIPNALQGEIGYVTYDYGREQKLHGYFVKRRDVMWGKELNYGESGNIKLLRLARKNSGVWEGKVHEVWKVKGKTGELRNPLMHYPHQSITEFMREINFYTDIRAQELFQKRTRVYWWSIIMYPLGKFLLNYFVRRGLLDGIQGFVFAVLMSFHSFLVRGKLWRLLDKEGK